MLAHRETTQRRRTAPGPRDAGGRVVRADLLIASSDRGLRGRLEHGLRGQVRRIDTAGDRATLERLLAMRAPGVLLLDVRLDGLGGLDDLEPVHRLSPATAIIVLVENPDDREAVRALKAGAKGYCDRTTDFRLLSRAVELVRGGEIWVGRTVMVALVDELTSLHRQQEVRTEPSLGRLTGREREVTSLVAAGASNKEIADRLAMTERTVKAHLTSVFRKLGLGTRLRLAIYAREGTTGTPTKVQ